MEFNQINFNAFGSISELCKIGFKYQTDKSPLSTDMVGWHSYTPFYDMLFSSHRYNQIMFGEIGIYKNSSMKMWREYFPNATLYGWDCKVEDKYIYDDQIDYVESAKRDNLQNTFYDYMNVKNEESISNCLNKLNVKFDILIEDSDHEFWSQIRVIRQSVNFLKPGAMLVIEDVGFKLRDYFSEIQSHGHDRFFSSLTQVKTYHQNQKYGADWDEIILLTRNGVEA